MRFINLIIILAILLVGCQQQIQEVGNIEIIDETPEESVVEENIEEEFEDGLDAALRELDEIEDLI